MSALPGSYAGVALALYIISSFAGGEGLRPYNSTLRQAQDKLAMNGLDAETLLSCLCLVRRDISNLIPTTQGHCFSLVRRLTHQLICPPSLTDPILLNRKRYSTACSYAATMRAGFDRCDYAAALIDTTSVSRCRYVKTISVVPPSLIVMGSPVGVRNILRATQRDRNENDTQNLFFFWR